MGNETIDFFFQRERVPYSNPIGVDDADANAAIIIIHQIDNFYQTIQIV